MQYAISLNRARMCPNASKVCVGPVHDPSGRPELRGFRQGPLRPSHPPRDHQRHVQGREGRTLQPSRSDGFPVDWLPAHNLWRCAGQLLRLTELHLQVGCRRPAGEGSADRRSRHLLLRAQHPSSSHRRGLDTPSGRLIYKFG